MKFITSIIFTLLLTCTAFSQYITPGTGVNWDLDDLVIHSSGAITYENTYYLLHENITISENDTVQVIADETIKLLSDILITSEGVLILSPPNEILITAMDTIQFYQGFKMDQTSGSVFRRCVFEFGNGIKLLNTDMIIDECTFRKNENNYSTGMLDLFYSNPQISNNYFYMNAGPAILSAANGESAPQIINNTIVYNVTANINMPQINLGSCMAQDTVIISHNSILGMYDQAGGIAVSLLAGGTLNCIIDHNIVEGNRYGITVYGNHIFSCISNNLIVDNNIQGDPYLGGSGINFWGDTTNRSVLEGNIIHGNLWGITVQNQALPNMGDDVTGYNQIYNNTNGGQEYALYNNTPNNLYAQNNFWGSNDPEEVEDVIFHHEDDPTLGTVYFLPLWDTISNIEIKKNHLENISLFPNPCKNYLTLDVSSVQYQQTYAVRIYSTTGQLVMDEKKVNDTQQSWNIEKLKEGNYFMEIRYLNQTQTLFFQKI